MFKVFPIAGRLPKKHKLIYILSRTARDGVDRLRLQTLQNAAGECVRLRYFIRNADVGYNMIRYCGTADFAGEGIYIGTAPEQTADGKNPMAEPDVSRDNRIHHNLIETHGNECVDIKEGATANVVEHNKCGWQRDANSAGLDSRGIGNIFRDNEVYETLGSGVRLGGDGSV